MTFKTSMQSHCNDNKIIRYDRTMQASYYTAHKISRSIDFQMDYTNYYSQVCFSFNGNFFR